MKKLPIIQIGKTKYYIDQRLSQIREVDNPNNYENVSAELIFYWLKLVRI